ncbi:MAG: FimV family protein [Massilia sp.]
MLAGLALTGAHAAELGEPRVSSHIGQQLVADIELTMLDDAAAPVQVRLANPDVYRGADLALPPILSSLTMSVMQRDGRQFLHVTSLKPVDSDHLHLYLELADGGRRSVRLATIWLAPDPNPAPPPAAPVRAPAPAPAADEPMAWAAPAEAPPRLRPAARPAVPPVLAKPARAPVPPQKPAACVPQVSEEARACMALGVKNAELRDKLGRVEGKVKALRLAMAPAPAQPSSKSAQPIPPGPAVPKRTARKNTGPADAAYPWRLIAAGGAALLALAGGAVLFARRRKAAQAKLSVPRGDIKSRLMPN